MAFCSKKLISKLKNRNFIDQSSEIGRLLVRDEAALKHKIQKIRQGGIKELTVMSDYDQTLTKLTYLDGKKADPTFKCIQDHYHTKDFIREESLDMFRKYYKIEQRTDLGEDEIMDGILYWFGRNLELYALREADYCKEKLFEATLESRLLFRRGIDSFFKLVQDTKLPLFIVSAGLGDVIENSLLILREGGEIENPSHDPVRIVSNFYKFKEEEQRALITDWERDFIHIFNKREKIYETKDVALDKKNVVLLGDIKQDCEMCDPEKHEIVLNLGFYNTLDTAGHPGDKNIDKKEFAKSFDIVIENDASIVPYVYLLQEILQVSILNESQLSELKAERDTYDRLKSWLV